MDNEPLTVIMGAPADPGPSIHQVKPTAPLPFIAVKEQRYYYCPRMHAQMIRHDGLVLTFLSGIHETNNAHSIYWLDNEIANGHPELFHATAEQIDTYLFKKDPRNHIKTQTRHELEEEISARLASMLSARMAAAGVSEGITPDDIKTMLASDSALPDSVEKAPEPVTKDSGDITSRLSQQLAAIRGNGVTLSGMVGTNASAI